ncbi:hypothetical protein ACIBQ1_56750 [Nonomuraea sp. NPDC050153]|uniref:hypothetical protein n=1 Tax=Nonomuraea sp. NPDC050153 TaxID=3364359 RepID=UPI0037BA023D
MRTFGVGAGLTGERLMDLVIAASEAATKVLEHGGDGTLIAWSDNDGVSLGRERDRRAGQGGPGRQARPGRVHLAGRWDLVDAPAE